MSTINEINEISIAERLFSLCDRLANGPPDEVSSALDQIKCILRVGKMQGEDGLEIEVVTQPPDFDMEETGDNGIRPLDVLCRGRDSDEACFAAMYLIQAGADASAQASPSEAAALHSTAYFGNWRMLCTLLDLGVDPNSQSNGVKQQLLGSNALHALATGFRSARAQDYAECFSALLGAGCDVDALDRKRQSPMDIAMRSAASTNDSTLIDAVFEYGVKIDGSSQLSAGAVAEALANRTKNYAILSKISASAFASVERSIDALRELQRLDPSLLIKPN